MNALSLQGVTIPVWEDCKQHWSLCMSKSDTLLEKGGYGNPAWWAAEEAEGPGGV